MKEQSEEAQARKHFLHWIGYLMRNHESNEVDFMQLLAKEYAQWGEQVLGRPRSLYYGVEMPCDYLRKAVRIASLAQLQELYAIRYILQHPVPDGVPYTGNCIRVSAATTAPRLATQSRLRKPAAAPTKERNQRHE